MTKLYVITDGDIDFSTCVGVYLTEREAKLQAEEYASKYEETNVSITEVEINL